jgi:hypothetical protein
MAIKVLGFDGAPFSQYHVMSDGARFMRCLLQLVFSGNYATNGDALDITNGGGTPAAPNTIPAAIGGAGCVAIDLMPRSPSGGLANSGGSYVIVPPNADAPMKLADLANLKLKIFKDSAGAIAEYPNGAYGADVLADLVQMEAIYTRL